MPRSFLEHPNSKIVFSLSVLKPPTLQYILLCRVVRIYQFFSGLQLVFVCMKWNAPFPVNSSRRSAREVLVPREQDRLQGSVSRRRSNTPCVQPSIHIQRRTMAANQVAASRGLT